MISRCWSSFRLHLKNRSIVLLIFGAIFFIFELQTALRKTDYFNEYGIHKKDLYSVVKGQKYIKQLHIENKEKEELSNFISKGLLIVREYILTTINGRG